jgi:hypothetical protein
VGTVTSAGLSGAIATVPGATDGFFFGTQTSGEWFELAGSDHDKTTQRPLVGDYDDDGLIDVIWYGAGSQSDELWYSVPAATSASERSASGRSAITAADPPTVR